MLKRAILYLRPFVYPRRIRADSLYRVHHIYYILCSSYSTYWYIYIYITTYVHNPDCLTVPTTDRDSFSRSLVLGWASDRCRHRIYAPRPCPTIKGWAEAAIHGCARRHLLHLPSGQPGSRIIRAWGLGIKVGVGISDRPANFSSSSISRPKKPNGMEQKLSWQSLIRHYPRCYVVFL